MTIISENLLNGLLGYPLGMVLIVLGLISLFPNITSKIVKKELEQTTIVQKIGAVFLIGVGIVLIVVRYMGIW